MNVGERIRELREKSGRSQNALAEWAGISQTHLRRVELGQADITVGHLQLICDALGVTLAEFFSVENMPDELSLAVANLSGKQKRTLAEFLKTI